MTQGQVSYNIWKRVLLSFYRGDSAVFQLEMSSHSKLPEIPAEFQLELVRRELGHSYGALAESLTSWDSYG